MKLVAKKGIMEFNFTLLSKSEDEIAIEMYNTEYRLVRDGERWGNKNGNKMIMSTELADAVIESVFSQ